MKQAWIRETFGSLLHLAQFCLRPRTFSYWPRTPAYQPRTCHALYLIKDQEGQGFMRVTKYIVSGHTHPPTGYAHWLTSHALRDQATHYWILTQ